MKKDITLAILIGLVFGVLAAFIVIFLPNLTKKTQSSKESTTIISPIPSRVENGNTIAIDIKNPPPDSVYTDKSATIEGSVKNGTLVVLDTDSDTSILTASDSGNFKANVSLTEGSNKFTITAYDDKGDSMSKTLMLYYTPEKI